MWISRVRARPNPSRRKVTFRTLRKGDVPKTSEPRVRGCKHVKRLQTLPLLDNLGSSWPAVDVLAGARRILLACPSNAIRENRHSELCLQCICEIWSG